MLQKKIERSQTFLQDNLKLFSCPVCQRALNNLTGYQLSCLKGHQFDLNKKGTLHFLNHKIDTDYDREMLTHRQRMIKAGLYLPLVKKVCEQLTLGEKDYLLDVGCGEGSLLNQVSEAGVLGTKIGFDISKDGIALATEQPEPAFWCVADLTNLPFTSGSINAILNIFSPSHYAEFRRVLAPKGKLIKVVPGENYLRELREIFYADKNQKQSYSNDKVVEKFNEEVNLLSRERLTYNFPVNDDLQLSLFKMSPLQWGASTDSLVKAKEKKVKSITIDVEILVGGS